MQTVARIIELFGGLKYLVEHPIRLEVAGFMPLCIEHVGTGPQEVDFDQADTSIREVNLLLAIEIPTPSGVLVRRAEDFHDRDHPALGAGFDDFEETLGRRFQK